MKLQNTAHGVARDPAGKSEDAWCVRQREESFIAVLTDGLGAAKEGGVAAQRAVEMLADYYLSRPQAWSPRRALSEFAAQINRLFHQESQLRHGSPELLCTLSAIAVEGDRLYGLSVGDSPVFLWRAGTLTQLTKPHSLKDDGLEHVVTRAIGLAPALEPHCFETAVENGDLLLLCSDGVSTVLPPARLGELLGRHAGARSIVGAAREATAENEELRDDASAIVVDIIEHGWRGAANRRALEVVPTLRATERVDDYQLTRALQEDGRVWLAETVDGTRRVLKFPPLDAATDEGRRDAFVREMWNATRIGSPDFVRAFTPAAGALRYYAMDYIDAPTLRTTLRAGPLPVEETVALGRMLLRAGQFLLTHDLAHGDLKPDNILVVREAGRPTRFLLLDLGSAAEVFSVTSRAGTPSYLAPERFHGVPLSERTEIFAIGVTLYEALTRTYPYGEIERFQTPRFENTPRRPSQANSAVPPWLESTILRAITSKPDDRYQNFSEMAFHLEHPEKVTTFARKGTPLLERNPLKFYKLLSFLLFVLSTTLLVLLLRR